MHGGADIGRRVAWAAPEASAARALLARALREGPEPALRALLEEVRRLTGASYAALHRGRRRVAHAGAPPGRGARLLEVRAGGVRLRYLAPGGHPALHELARAAADIARAREREAEARAHAAALRLQLRAQGERLQQHERRRSRAAHDLRTPLMVMKGYVDMLQRGLGGPLAPAAARYLERMARAVTEQHALLERRLGRTAPPATDLRPLLHAAFDALPGPDAPRVGLELPGRAALVRADPATLGLLLRALARGLTATRASAVDVALDAPEGTGTWRLRAWAQTTRPLPAARQRALEAVVARLGGHLALQARPRLALTLHLPAAD